MPKKLNLEILGVYNISGIAESYFEKIGKSYKDRQAYVKAFTQLTNNQINKDVLLKVLREAHEKQSEIIKNTLD